MMLMRGNQGDAVSYLQAQLNEAAKKPLQFSKYPPLVVDGIFGGATQARVSEFQMINRLSSDGIAGPNTQGALDGIVGPLQLVRTQGGAPGTGGWKVQDKAFDAGGWKVGHEGIKSGWNGKIDTIKGFEGALKIDTIKGFTF